MALLKPSFKAEVLQGDTSSLAPLLLHAYSGRKSAVPLR